MAKLEWRDGLVEKDISLDICHRLIEPGCIVLVTAGCDGRTNVMTGSWVVPISHHPPLVGVSINHAHFTHDVVDAAGEYVLHVPGPAMIPEVNICGTLSGRDVDKFEAAGLRTSRATSVGCPLIEGCLGWLECKVVERFRLGDHTLFVGEVMSASAENKAFDGRWLLSEGELCPIHYLGGITCATLRGQSLTLR